MTYTSALRCQPIIVSVQISPELYVLQFGHLPYGIQSEAKHSGGRSWQKFYGKYFVSNSLPYGRVYNYQTKSHLVAFSSTTIFLVCTNSISHRDGPGCTCGTALYYVVIHCKHYFVVVNRKHNIRSDLLTKNFCPIF